MSRRVCVDRPVGRIVSLAPNLTETLFILGLGDRLVGRTQRCNKPVDAQQVPVVGAYMRPDLERIIAAQPHLVFTTKAAASRGAVQRLEGLRIPVFVSDCRNIDDVISLVTKMGDLLHVEGHAAEVAEQMRTRRAAVHARCTDKGKPTVLFAVGVRPLIVAGGASFIGALIREAAGTNVMEDTAVRYPKLNIEHVIQADPEVIVTLDKECGSDEESCIHHWQRYPMVSAVRNERIFILDGDLMARPSPRIIGALERLARLLHPTAFSGKLENGAMSANWTAK